MPQDFLRTRRLLRWITKPGMESSTRVPLPEGDLCDCCDPDKVFILEVLADTETNDPSKNDFWALLYELPLSEGVTSFQLQKFNGINWTPVANLVDPTYGTNYPLGIFPDFPNYFGFKLQWKSVLTLHGEGVYRIKVSGPNVNGDEDVDYSPYFCLKEFNKYNADTTVKWQWNSNGSISNADDDFQIFHYGNINWHQMIRLKGMFGFPNDEDTVLQTSEYDGEELRINRVRHITNYKYKFVSGAYPFWVHQILKNIAFKSNSLNVTTYSRLDKHRYEVKQVIKEPNGYQPNYDASIYNKWTRVTVEFRDKSDDLGMRRYCQPQGENCSPVEIQNSEGSFIEFAPSGSIYIIPTGSGTPVDELTCQELNNGLSENQRNLIQCVAPIVTGQVTSYATGDDGYSQNGRLVDFFTLNCNNGFGNTNRFTDTLGTQLYANNIVVDWATSIMHYRIPFGTVANWAAAVSGAIGQTIGGFTDWEPYNENEMVQIKYRGQNDTLNYAPFNIPATPYANIWTGTTDSNSSTMAIRIVPVNGNMVSLNKSSSGVYYMVKRNFILADLGL